MADTAAVIVRPHHWSNSALILLGHGSGTTPGSGNLARKHAETIRRRALFAETRVAYLRDEPLARSILGIVDRPDVYIVPFMVADGYTLDRLIPREMKLAGPLTERVGPKGRHRVHLCRAVGTHPQLSDWSIKAIRELMDSQGLRSRETAVLVVAHGTPRHPAGADQARTLASHIENRIQGVETATAFLEVAPRIATWRRLVSRRDVIVVPHMMGFGRHVSNDVPRMLGLGVLQATDADILEAGAVVGPLTLDRRRIWYGPLFGASPAMPDAIVDRVLDWERPADELARLA